MATIGRRREGNLIICHRAVKERVWYNISRGLTIIQTQGSSTKFGSIVCAENTAIVRSKTFDIIRTRNMPIYSVTSGRTVLCYMLTGRGEQVLVAGALKE